MDVAKTIERQPKNTAGLPFERIKMAIKYVSFTEVELLERGIVL